MLRSAFLWLSERRGVFNFVKRNGLARRFASRFVAGETLDTAIAAARDLNQRDITVTLDLLGESVTSREEAREASNQAVEILNRIHASGVRGNVSVKLTQMGLDIDRTVALENMTRILDRARELQSFARIDMEASAYVEPTLDLFRNGLHERFGDTTGVVIQSMLRRSADDVADLIARHARVRLVKGAYSEPASIAFPDKRDVDRSFATLAERLLAEGNYPAIATHDERLIRHVTEFVAHEGIANSRFEFQMLYGVRRDLQDRLRREGYNVRVYVPFGTQWYPYLMRRLGERPANVAFIVGNLLKETVSRR
ncbi:MAG TPA: proline dehydrogenase family protein [Gemmatimonadales bacterium]|jgi:proline dehydrogenase|nr:proline dehydrogenase family protein [Gemmatimonadales bacterium]